MFSRSEIFSHGYFAFNSAWKHEEVHESFGGGGGGDAVANRTAISVWMCPGLQSTEHIMIIRRKQLQHGC
jgi:hypothetical protein